MMLSSSVWQRESMGDQGMLRYKEDRRTLFFVSMYFVATALVWVSPLSGWGGALAVAMLAAWSWQCAVITHNTIHAPIFESRTLNRAFQVVLTQTYGHPVSTFVPGHNLSHHRFTEQARDVMRTSKVRFRWHLLNLLFFFPAVIPGIVRGERAYIKAMRTQRPRWYRQLVLEAVVLYGLMAALAVLDWRKFLLYWYVPHLWASMGIVTINLFWHDGCDVDSEYNHSRNFTGRLFNWWTFNNGYHTLHHIQPSLHWSLLPKVHAEKVAPHMHPNLAQPSILLYLWRTFIWPGKRLRYDGTPHVLPPQMADEPWAPRPGQVIEGMSLGAES